MKSNEAYDISINVKCTARKHYFVVERELRDAITALDPSLEITNLTIKDYVNIERPDDIGWINITRPPIDLELFVRRTQDRHDILTTKKLIMQLCSLLENTLSNDKRVMNWVNKVKKAYGPENKEVLKQYDVNVELKMESGNKIGLNAYWD